MPLAPAAPFAAAAEIERDDALFGALEEDRGGEVLRMWELDRPAVVIGRSGDPDRDVHPSACASDGVSIIRRSTGGGAVVLGPGCLSYTLVLSMERRPLLRDVAASYQWILSSVAKALEVDGLEVVGHADLAIGDRKVGGSAQRRGRRALLHHGTLLYRFDPSLMERYLKHPVRTPAYRGHRPHSAFVANLALDGPDIGARLRRWRQKLALAVGE